MAHISSADKPGFSAAQIPSEVDVIICGGGTAGCVIAGRLAAADPSLSILVLEAGPTNFNAPTIVRPGLYLEHQKPTNPFSRTFTGKVSDYLGGRTTTVVAGRTLGGGSSVNFMMYTRGCLSDYDSWNTKGWEGKNMVPFLKKFETFTLPGGAKDVHGDSGPLKISLAGATVPYPEDHITATKTMGYEMVDDLNDLTTLNAYMMPWPKYIDPKTGHRQDSAHKYLHPSKSTNLHVLTDTQVDKVIIKDGKAVAVEYIPKSSQPDGKRQMVRARKLVVLSGGAFGTCGILERSGVGKPEILKKHGIKTVVDLPGVGENYQDHNLILPVFKMADDFDSHDEFHRREPGVMARAEADWKQGKGKYADNFVQFAGKLTPSVAEAAALGPEYSAYHAAEFVPYPDKPAIESVHINAFLGPQELMPRYNYITAGIFANYPVSRGSVHISSTDPGAHPDFDAGFLSNPIDMHVLKWAYKRSREVLRRMQSYRGEMAVTHPQFPAGSAAVADERPARPATTFDPKAVTDIVYHPADDAAIEKWIRDTVQTTWHSLGTCAMKPRAAGGVVDGNLDVYGVRGLKIVDMSICPSNVGGNVNSTAFAIGEKGASIIAEMLGCGGQAVRGRL
ncbi:GMC oxidoreductase-domain-containing protein [Geopyxis carbonaria]|nr:GMC oxidoreductase-domain-containing protein [Geopyxis carbonaria]